MALKVTDLGLIGYVPALELQELLVNRVCDGAPETLLLLEHEPVYTIGSGGSVDNVLEPGISPLRVNRGGDITYHGPGQLVGYPILDLSRRGRDLHRYLRFLESFLVGIAETFCVTGFTVPGRTGVWTERGKLASIGVGVRRWVTMHGFALNVSLDPAPFGLINPCGMPGCPITSLAAERICGCRIKAVKDHIAARLETALQETMNTEQPD